MKRRPVLASALAVVALTGCLSTTGDSGTKDTSTRTPTETTETDDSTPTATSTIPPYSKELDSFTVSNTLSRPVTVEVEISAQERDESEVFTVELDADSRKRYDDLSILDEPVTFQVTYDGDRYEYTPQTDGMLRIRVLDDDVKFEEVST